MVWYFLIDFFSEENVNKNAVRAIAQINPLPGLRFIMLFKKTRSVISFLKEDKKNTYDFRLGHLYRHQASGKSPGITFLPSALYTFKVEEIKWNVKEKLYIMSADSLCCFKK